ncbi:hypothetical protein NDI56_15870 [Haloarcula sp. S1CR25-12]|uniref:DUF4282 domain-containing protein n=1 Tax=Haloarcula saliterrae TaxID=2950534 RepID=A0ABU2FG03_9EURY|nr:hypothetical protein [Haloarcula sp. S1CR25-12]MDS0260883.1 hypothetical protein [Haloarcula sp. S1CR25-12]
MTGDESEKDPSEHLATGSGQVVDGISDTSTGLKNIGVSVWEWFGNHPVVRWFVGLLLGWFVMQGVLEFTGTVYQFFFTRVTPVTGDINVRTTPLPLGLSINILFFLWLVTTYAAVARIIRLRQRIEELEQQAGSQKE